MATTGQILDNNYVKQRPFAAANKISEKTVARMRQDGLPYAVWGGEIYIHVPGARDYLQARIKRRNQRRTA